jgi:MraZ protein
VERRYATGVLDLNVGIERMFLGQFYHNLDEKGRLTMPARFRELLAEDGGAFLMRGFDQNLIMLTATTFTTVSDHINEMSFTDPKARELRRLLFSKALQIEFDKIGRFLLPPYLRDDAQITNEAVIIGAGKYVEIWSPRIWTAQWNQLNDAASLSDRFKELNIPFL